MVLFAFRIGAAATKVRLQVVENGLIPRDNYSTHQTQEPPVLDVDSTIWVYTTQDSRNYAQQRMH